MDIKDIEREVFKFSFRRYITKADEIKMDKEEAMFYYNDYKEKLEEFIKQELLKDKKIKEVRKLKMNMKNIIKIDSFTEKYIIENY